MSYTKKTKAFKHPDNYKSPNTLTNKALSVIETTNKRFSPLCKKAKANDRIKVLEKEL
jgi:hypothetical protein